MQISEEDWRKVSHGQRRALINRERKRRKRQALARGRDAEQAALESQPGYWEELAEDERTREKRERREEAKRLLEHEAWLKKERVAQEEFRKKRELQERLQREKEERERLIREEWEALQQKEEEAEKKREKARSEKEVKSVLPRAALETTRYYQSGQERLKEALSVGEKPQAEQPWHNPLAPDGQSDPANYGTEKDTHNCAFYLKTGACRFGDRCSRQHPQPHSSTTLLIRGMYSNLGLTEQMLDEQDHDAALEYEEGEIYEHFREFYDDLLPEFSKAGKIVQFKVSCNYEPHLRGNVYIQYSTEEECAAAFTMFNGRWYAQRQLSCEFSPVQKWRSAICGLFNRKRCPKGRHCNFLHVFRNPGRAFSWADRDLPPPSSTSRRGSSSQQDWSTRSWRSSRHRSRSRSRERHFRTRSRSRDRTRDRRRSRSRSRSRDRSHFRSWERRRSRSRSRDRDRRHSRRPRDHSRSRSRSRSRERYNSKKHGHRRREWDRRHSDDRSRSKSPKSKDLGRITRSRSKSPSDKEEGEHRSESQSVSLEEVSMQSNRKDCSGSKSPQPEGNEQRTSKSPSPLNSPNQTEKRHSSKKRKRSPDRTLSASQIPERKKHKKKQSSRHHKHKKHHNHSDAEEETKHAESTANITKPRLITQLAPHDPEAHNSESTKELSPPGIITECQQLPLAAGSTVFESVLKDQVYPNTVSLPNDSSKNDAGTMATELNSDGQSKGSTNGGNNDSKDLLGRQPGYLLTSEGDS